MHSIAILPFLIPKYLAKSRVAPRSDYDLVMLRSRPLEHSPVMAAILLVITGILTGCFAHSTRPTDSTTTEKDPLSSHLSSPLGSRTCQVHFPDQNGWYGGDAAYSVPLPQLSASKSRSRSVWLFGDTFIERADQPGRRAYPYVHNSIGISRCAANGDWSLETFWKSQDEATSGSFFQPNPESSWATEAREKTGRPPYYWPMDGFVVNGSLFVGLLRVTHSEPRGPFSLPFRIIGTDLARIENPNDSPQNWRVRISMLSEDPVFFPGTAFAVLGEHVYAFGFFDRDDGHAPRGLIRLPIEALSDSENVLSERIETFEVNGSWKRGLRAQSAAIVIPSDATEMSVHWNSGRNRWIAVEASPSHTESDPSERGLIRFRESDKLEGPWSTARPLLQIAELQPSSLDTTATNTFCYAAKAHSQYSKAGELIITYVCSLYARSPEEEYMVLEELTHRSDLYRPRVVRVPLPPVDSGSR